MLANKKVYLLYKDEEKDCDVYKHQAAELEKATWEKMLRPA